MTQIVLQFGPDDDTFRLPKAPELSVWVTKRPKSMQLNFDEPTFFRCDVVADGSASSAIVEVLRPRMGQPATGDALDVISVVLPAALLGREVEVRILGGAPQYAGSSVFKSLARH